jgi:predicted permease
MGPLSQLVRHLVPRDWRDTVERDLAEEQSRWPASPAQADVWMAWQFVRIGAGLRWHRRRIAAGLGGVAVVRGNERSVQVPDRGRHVRAALTVTRDAWRALRGSPSTAAFAVLILTVAIAAATVTFSVVDAVVLRSLPYQDSDRIVRVGRDFRDVHSPPEFVGYRERADALEAVAAYVGGPLVEVRPGDDFAYGFSMATTAEFFDVLQVRPQLGRLFTASSEVSGEPTVAVISHELWQREFGGDPEAMGQTLRLVRRRQVRGGGVSETVEIAPIIGVLPAHFTFRDQIHKRHVFVPLVVDPGARADSRFLNVLGRLRDGVSVAEAQTQLMAIRSAVATARGNRLRDSQQPVVTPLLESLLGDYKGWMLLVLWTAGLLLVVACVNVANLMLLRSAERARALAVRASLGASRRHLAATLLVESLILSLTAAGLGVLLAFWGVDAAKAAIPPYTVFRAETIAVDLHVLTVSVITAIAAGIFFGVVPAWHAAQSQPASLIGSGTSRVTSGHRRWRTGFLVGEVVLVGAMLVVSTMFVGSFVRVIRTDLGFVREGLVSVTLDEFTGDTAPLLQVLRAIPGVVSVAEWTGPPPPLVQGGILSTIGLKAAEHASEPGEIMAMPYRISPNYFETAGIQLLRGRPFTESDADAPIAIIDELTAQALFFDGRDPVGAGVSLGVTSPVLTVVGVVRTVIRGGPEGSSGPLLYRPKPSGPSRRPQFLVRTSGAAAAALPTIERSLQQALPAGTTAPIVRSIEEEFDEITAGRRANATIMSLFGLVVLLIGAAGVYAVMASTVAQRQRELGIRAALGATRGRIMRAVLGHAAVYLTTGLAVGLAAGRALSTVFASMLFEVRPGDASIYAIVAALLLMAGLVAALRPALRAARVDPIITLRAE